MKKKLTKEENLRLVLKKKIEKVLFNEEELTILKDLIYKVSIGTTPAKTLREFIINFRGDASDKLLEKTLPIFEFYAHQTATQDQLSEFTSRDDSRMKADLQEKNELLEKVAIKIDNMHKGLKERLAV